MKGESLLAVIVMLSFVGAGGRHSCLTPPLTSQAGG
jgi:hypothetical protein